MQRLSTTQADFPARFERLLHFDATQSPEVDRAVAEILREVRTRGDAALLEYTQRYDHVSATQIAALTLTPADCSAAYRALPDVQREALTAAAARIRSYHERQLQHGWQYTEADGTVLGQAIHPLERVGIYVPGGKASYPSSVLMNAIPAQIAGVREILMAVPPGTGVPIDIATLTGAEPSLEQADTRKQKEATALKGPEINRFTLVLAAAHLAGVHRVYTIGGAQAIAAFAYGTETIPAVDKISGPGNQYVAAAKRAVFGRVGIDMVAGPSEILVICDGSSPPDWIALDLFSQAEHDEIAQAILLCPDALFLDAVAACIARLLPTQPRRAIIEASLAGRGALVQVRDLTEACALANQIAPEHLLLSVADPWVWQPKIQHAGAIFLGRFSSESLGDYCAGPNHVLPTARSARFASPLGVYDFQKRTSLIAASPEGARTLGALAAVLATGEGLPAHAAAAAVRHGAHP